jgi:prolyl-tRNA synthetase
VLDSVTVLCPYCGEEVEIALDPESAGVLVEDCQVCCNPWRLTVRRGGDGEPEVEVERLD